MNVLEDWLQRRFGARLERNRSLAGLSSFKIGGPADLFLTVNDEVELSVALTAAARCSAPVFCLGAGTNLLISDRGMRGLVVKLGAGFAQLTIDGTNISAGGALQFRDLVETVVERGLKGLEFGEGIPGSVGGGLVMNAGAFGGEMASVVTRVFGVTKEGESRALTNEEIGFTYRRSNLPHGFIITRVDFKLEDGQREELRAHVMSIRAHRETRQPQGLPNAGSVFKNPPGKHAGRLLELSGLKGMRIGNAAFSCQHANFIVNLGNATAAEVYGLMEIARDRVRHKAGVLLEPEIRLVGDW